MAAKGFLLGKLGGSGGDNLSGSVTENVFPIGAAGNTLADSSQLKYDPVEDEFVSSIPLRVPAGTIYIGPQLGLDDAGQHLA